jgi:hypothetical protein
MIGPSLKNILNNHLEKSGRRSQDGLLEVPLQDCQRGVKETKKETIFQGVKGRNNSGSVEK